jgi:signal transduction histidine kinase
MRHRRPVPVPLRLRVVAVFTAAATIAFVGLGLFVYYRVEATLHDQARVALDAQMDALADLPESGRRAAIEAMTGEFFAQVLTPDGTLVASSPQLSGPVATGDLPVPAPGEGPGEDIGEDVEVKRPVRLVEDEGEEGDEGEAAILLLRRDGDQVLLVGTSREDLDDALWGVRTQLLIGGPLALLLASAAGYLAAGTALRPMERMRRHAEAVSAHSAGERLPLPAAHDEIRRLGLTLNQMLDRLDTGLQRERRFVAEASHELRTPLALLKLEIDLALAQPRPTDELVAALRSAGEEVDRLTRLSDDLLLLASAQDGRSLQDQTDVDVRSLLKTSAARYSARAGQEGRRIVVRCDGRPIVRAHAGRFERALSNLVDNAVRHGAGDIELGSGWSDGRVSIWVTDHGPGLDDELRAHVLEPFGRSPTPRSQDGRGLGLTIVQAIVAELHGTVIIENGSSDGGTVATIAVPGRRAP